MSIVRLRHFFLYGFPITEMTYHEHGHYLCARTFGTLGPSAMKQWLALMRQTPGPSNAT